MAGDRVSEESDSGTGEPLREGKYARIERERRFLLAEPPPAVARHSVRWISDRYLTGTRLRLRLIRREDTSALEYKLTQKVPSPRRRGVQGLITNIYLDRAEYDLIASLPASVVTKTRTSLPPMSIDVFSGHLDGLVIAEAECTSDADCNSFVPPSYGIAEVTTDTRFTGGRLARVSRNGLLAVLTEFGITPAALE